MAVVVQFWQSVIEKHNSPSNFFSFFTIQSNLFACAVFLWLAIQPSSHESSSGRDLIRGAVVLYMSITGVVYGLLLSGLQAHLQVTIPWVNTILHRLMPIIMVVDWLVDPPLKALTFRKALIWLLYPVVWLTYTLIRGPLINWYPYPFLNPSQTGGYTAVAAYCICITLGLLLFTWLIVAIGKRIRLVIE